MTVMSDTLNEVITALRQHIASRLDDTEASLECATGAELRAYLQGFADGLIDADVELLRLIEDAP